MHGQSGLYCDRVLKVLILDDDPMVVDMLALRLRMPCLHLTTCLEIEAAEALLNAFRYDVVVTDLSVSNLGGLEGMRLIRFVTTNFPDTTIFVLSGFVDDTVRSLCGMLGVAAVLEKPEGLSQLRDLLVARRATVPGGLNEATPEVQQIEMLEASWPASRSSRCCSRWSACSGSGRRSRSSAWRGWPAARRPRCSATPPSSWPTQRARRCCSRPT
jgi:CheY-like chemotaxis protein